MTKRYNSLFEIIGPVMVGPSSSHTAGAVRLGNIARLINEAEPKKVLFYLFGSFAETYKGHGTDVALVGGILGMNTENPNIPNAMLIAQQKGIDFKFIPLSDEVEHPNTVQMIMYDDVNKRVSVTGSSIGGGSVKISMINDTQVNISSGISTILIEHQDTPGMISNVANVLSELNINISSMSVQRNAKGGDASMMIEVDDAVDLDAVNNIKKFKDIHKVIFIPKDIAEVYHD